MIFCLKKWGMRIFTVDDGALSGNVERLGAES